MTEKQIGGNGMAKRQPTVLRVPENGAGDPFFGRQGNWFEVIFESSYDGFYITDGNAITLTLNKSYETISGLRKEEMVGRSMAELVASRVISASGTLLALERRESVTMEQQFKTGKRAIITSTPVFDSESNIVMVVTNVRDVTELYSLKEQLEQSEERNRLYSAELEAARSRQDRNPSSLIFHDKSMQNVISLLNRAAQMEVPVLLQGEVGVGKGALSEYIYSKSKRRKEHFITIPCASLPDDTMVAELFGLGPGVSPEYPQGKTGLLEQANRGVVFLDEVEQLNHESQTRLLSAIKRRQVKPLGYGADKPCDLRIIASTSADLLALVREKKFREDLYYALSVLPINVPPLRERREDIPYKLIEMTHLNETLYCCGIACSAEGHKTESGNYIIDLLLANVCKQNVTRFPYEIVRLAEDIAGGLMVTAPSEKDLRDEKIGPYIDKYLRGVATVTTENRMKILRLIENLALGTAAVGYRTESMHGAGSPQAQRIMISRQGNLNAKKELAKAIAHIEE